MRQQFTEVGAVRIQRPEGMQDLEHVASRDLQAFVNGDAGWAADRVVFHLSNGYQVRFRLTAVFERVAGEWRIVHWHASVPSTNEDVLGFELTTSIDVLAEAIEREKPDLSPSVSIEGTVTILFTDIEGSTALNEQLGDERWSRVLKMHDRSVRETVAAHGGTTVERIGDGCMLAFPSARRAIECAIALQRGSDELADDIRFRIRIGAHTGEPIREAGVFYGRDVAYAARVGALAVGGEILVSSLVKELCAGGSFTFAQPREVELKGFDGIQLVYPVDRSS
jgi:class 3 adenylate cyclase